jgi:hypothetical protein
MKKIWSVLGFILLFGGLFLFFTDTKETPVEINERNDGYIVLNVFGVTKENISLEYVIILNSGNQPINENELIHHFKDVLTETSVDDIDMLTDKLKIRLNSSGVIYKHLKCLPTKESEVKIDEHLNRVKI